MISKTTVARRSELDVLRILACIMVIGIHVCFQGWHKVSTQSLAWQGLNLCNCFVRGSVSVFVMLSGINFLKEEKPLALLFRKYILRIAVLTFLWLFLYAVDTIGLSAFRSLLGIKQLAVHFLKGKYHLWYLKQLVGAYLAIPILWCIVHWQDGKYLKYYVLFFACYRGIIGLMSVLPGWEYTGEFLSKFSPPFINFLSVMLLGYYVDEKLKLRLHSITWGLLFFATVLLTAAANGILSYRSGKPQDELLSNFSIPSILEGVCLLQFFKGLRSSQFITKRAKLLSWLSSCTLGIYLLHVFVLEHLEGWFSFNIFSAPLPISVPALIVSIFLICLAVVAPLRRIPVLGKWII